MTLQQLKYAIVISETGSMNKAAEQLYIAQPSLTEAVRSLERELGITIFNRGSRGVTLTADGVEFISYARQVYAQYENLEEHFGLIGKRKQRFGVSTQHYSFVVKAFIDTIKDYDASEYEFAIRETRTQDVIDDVSESRSEIGVLYFNNFNRHALEKILKTRKLSWYPLAQCGMYAYLWKEHPLAGKKSLKYEDLLDYACLSFEQGAEATFYFAEEALSTRDYPKSIRTNDRATMLNLMKGLNGYTLCCGHICEELNGGDYIAVPLVTDEEDEKQVELVYIIRKDTKLTEIGEEFLEELRGYLESAGPR